EGELLCGQGSMSQPPASCGCQVHLNPPLRGQSGSVHRIGVLTLIRRSGIRNVRTILATRGEVSKGSEVGKLQSPFALPRYIMPPPPSLSKTRPRGQEVY